MRGSAKEENGGPSGVRATRCVGPGRSRGQAARGQSDALSPGRRSLENRGPALPKGHTKSGLFDTTPPPPRAGTGCGLRAAGAGAEARVAVLGAAHLPPRPVGAGARPTKPRPHRAPRPRLARPCPHRAMPRPRTTPRHHRATPRPNASPLSLGPSALWEGCKVTGAPPAVAPSVGLGSTGWPNPFSLPRDGSGPPNRGSGVLGTEQKGKAAAERLVNTGIYFCRSRGWSQTPGCRRAGLR